MQKVKYYKCPACKKVYNSLKPWSNHMLTAHKELIPEGWSPARYFYYIQTGKAESEANYRLRDWFCRCDRSQHEWTENRHELKHYGRWKSVLMCVVICIFIMPYEELFKERQSGYVERLSVHIRRSSNDYIRACDGRQNYTCVSISNTHVILSCMHISRSLLNMGNTVKAQPGI